MKSSVFFSRRPTALPTSRPTRFGLALTALALVQAAGCCCSSTYDDGAYATWKNLERGVYEAPTSIAQDKTGVSIQLPIVFDAKKRVAYQPGGAAERDKLQPPQCEIPGLQTTFEMQLLDADRRKMPMYCYVGVVGPTSAERKSALDAILTQIKNVSPEAGWESKTIDGLAQPASKLSVSGSQAFTPGQAGMKPTDVIGQFDVYVVPAEFATVIVGWRAPVDIAQRVSLFKAAEAAVGTIKSVEPTQQLPEVDPSTGGAPAGDYAVAPGTDVELKPPAGFAPAASVSGYLNSQTQAAIRVNQSPDPYSALVAQYAPERLAANNIVTVATEDATIDGGPAKLLLLKTPDQTFWNLVFGDDKRTFVVTAQLVNPDDDAAKQALRASLLTARKKQ
ncbi:MAG: hypothetical protein KDA41_01895 [Planctomycetales bacterium]|nr:hypothetical protein [Planctomycetales bacterium]